MGKYKKCPRCELNYIKEDEEYCEVCKSEMIHHSEDEEEFLDIEDLEICPVCGQNYIRENQTMCDECRAKAKEDDSDSSIWEDENSDADDIVTTDDSDSQQDDYNDGFSDIDQTEDDSFVDDELPLGGEDETIEFSADEEPEEEVEEEVESVDTFETIDEESIAAVDDDEDDEEDDDDLDLGDDILGKK